jgi:tRNA threonylcarbamoyladenosine biosynthesis protein TsaE
MIWDELKAGVVTASAEETRRLAARLGAALPPDAILALHGDLGAGKTTFVQGLARAFGIHEPVTSPTFTIFTLHRGSRTLVHLDAYRLNDGRQLEALMLEDFLTPPWCLAVEWPENIAGWLPADALQLDLAITGEGRHRIALRGG